MTVTVSFVTPAINGSGPGVGIGRVRVKEVVTIPGTTTATALAGEFVLVGNGEATMSAVAFGSTPDAAATAETAATSAGYPVGAGQVSDPFIVKLGDKVNIKAA